MSIKVTSYDRRVKVSSIDEIVKLIEDETIHGYEPCIVIEDTSNSLGDQRNAPKFSIDNEQDYADCVEQIRLRLGRNKDIFAYIQTGRNGKLRNPYYFNLIVNKLWALEMNKGEKKTAWQEMKSDVLFAANQKVRF